jgi:signal transduction histidine kinase
MAPPGRRRWRMDGEKLSGARHAFDKLRFTLIAGVAALMVLAMVFTLVTGAGRITTAALRLNHVNEILRPATVMRAQLALGVNMAAQDRVFGTNSAHGLEISLGETEEATSQLEAALSRFADLGGGSKIEQAVGSFLGVSGTVVDLLEEGDSVTAQRLAESSLDSDFHNLLDVLVAERDSLKEVVEAADGWLTKINTWTRFGVAFLVPSIIIFVYAEFARRRQRQSELELSLAAEQALRRTRDEFIANASHELRTPLTSIYGLARILEEEDMMSDPSTAHELLSMIITESSDLGRIVEDLLTSARLDAGELSFVLEDVAVLSEVTEVIGPMIRSGIDVDIDCSDCEVRVDRGRFRQVVRNLVSNALKYGGPHIRIRGRTVGDMYELVVEDDGPGVPADLTERLFERFSRQQKVATRTGSVGLGLSIVKALAEGQGGSIGYERAQGWTRFVLRLPGAAANRPAKPVHLVAV